MPPLPHHAHFLDKLYVWLLGPANSQHTLPDNAHEPQPTLAAVLWLTIFIYYLVSVWLEGGLGTARAKWTQHVWKMGTNIRSHFFPIETVRRPENLWFTQWGSCGLSARGNSFSRGKKAESLSVKEMFFALPVHMKYWECQSQLNVHFVDTGWVNLVLFQQLSLRETLVKKEHRSLYGFI